MLKKTIKSLAFLISLIMVFSCFSILHVFGDEGDKFEYFIEEKSTVITGIKATVSGEVVIPETLGGYPVKKIEGAFRYKSKISSVVLPDTVTTITKESFAYCSKLKSVQLPESLTFIGESAFCGCTLLEKIDIPDSVATIGEYAFSWCTKLSSVKLPSSLYTIEAGVFYGCSALDSIDISDKVGYIMQDAFCDTKYYKNKDNWENGVLYIGNHLIAADNTVSEIYEVKPGTKAIAQRAFSAASSLTGVIIYSDVKIINDSAFSGCPKLSDVYYGDTIENRRRIKISSGNSYFVNAIWHYGYDPNVKEYAPGDINGDESINTKDVLRLFKYLSGWDVEITEMTVDVNGDQSVDNLDLIRLFQYVSGWDVKIYSKSVGEEYSDDDQGPVISF